MKLSKTEVDALIAASPRAFAPFNKLVLSDTYQARPPGSTPQLSIEELAASIKENGVLQNLVVVQGTRGRFEVCAGGRRLAALALLVTGGAFAENFPVPVLIVPPDRALLASIAENCFHIPMHPADEYAAFAKLIGQGKSVEDVAAAFGVTPLVVKRRMKLAAVSPALMAQFRGGDIGLDCLMVLASVDDHGKQEAAWAALPSWNRRADYLRQLLTQGEIESDRDPLARFVGVAAYEAAGGASRRDLFSADGEKVYLLDAPLLERLALEKLQAPAAEVAAAGWKWVEVRARYVYDEFVRFGELRRTRREPSAEEAQALARLDAQLADLEAQMEALAMEEGDEEAYGRLEAEFEAIQGERQAQEDALSEWPAELMAQAGCVVHVGPDGAVAVKAGLVRPEDRDELVAVASPGGEGGRAGAVVSLPAPKSRPVHSEKLLRRLTAHRVVALQAELVERPDVALAALAAQLAQAILPGLMYRRPDKVFGIAATDSQSELRSAADDLEQSPAWTKLDAERAAWMERLPAEPEAIFPWLLNGAQETVQPLLAFLIAATTTGIYGSEPVRQANEPLAQALGLDMRRWWTASGPAYFDHVSKSRLLEVVAEAVDLPAASPLAALRKAAAVARAERIVAGSGWLPTVLRVAAAAAPAAGPAAPTGPSPTDEALAA